MTICQELLSKLRAIQVGILGRIVRSRLSYRLVGLYTLGIRGALPDICNHILHGLQSCCVAVVAELIVSEQPILSTQVLFLFLGRGGISIGFLYNCTIAIVKDEGGKQKSDRYGGVVRMGVLVFF